MQQNQPAILVLEDGTVFEGIAIGKIGTTGGEIAFNTGMTGYQEVFTDPSYVGQLLIMTTAHIGNYGVHENEIESDSIKIAGLVTKKFSNGYSRSSANESLQELMERNGTVGISDIDTRALVRHMRNKGAMNAIISSEEMDINILKQNLVRLFFPMIGMGNRIIEQKTIIGPKLTVWAKSSTLIFLQDKQTNFRLHILKYCLILKVLKTK